MTERARDRSSAPEPRGNIGIALLWAAAAVFLAMLALLSVRVSDGVDPALRARAIAAPPPRRVLVRRVYERRVIVHLPATASMRPSSASQQITSAGATAQAPVTRTS